MDDYQIIASPGVVNLMGNHVYISHLKSDKLEICYAHGYKKNYCEQILVE